MKILTYIAVCIAVAFVLQAGSCDKSEMDALDKGTVSVPEEASDSSLTVLDTSFCGGLYEICPKLWRLAQLYPPRRDTNPIIKSYKVHPELVSYFLDSLRDQAEWIYDLPVPCPGITRDHIICAMGPPRKPRSSELYCEWKHEVLQYESYDFVRDLNYGSEPTIYWQEPMYIGGVFYRPNDTLAFIGHNGI